MITAKTINRLFGSPLLILMYHRFTKDSNEGYALKEEEFEKQIKFLRKTYTIIALEEYFSLTEREKSQISKPAAITVDDGYMNFYLHGYPVLNKYTLPATVYLPANFIESGQWMWQDINKFILRNTEKQQIRFEWKNKEYILPLSSRSDLMMSLEKVYGLCMNEPNGGRGIFSRSLADAAGVRPPEKPDGEFAPLTWGQIKVMGKNRIYFGSHTMNHEVLTEIDNQMAKEEIARSKTFLEDRLARKIEGFCYPNGNYNMQISKQVEECGYQYAVTTEKGFNTRGVPMMCLRRSCAPASGAYLDMLRCCCWRPLKDAIKHKMR